MDKTLQRISKDSANAKVVWEKAVYRFAVSPDATKAAFVEKKGDGRVLKIISTADKSLLEVIQPAIRDHRMPEIAWMHDGKGLFYISGGRKFRKFHTLAATFNQPAAAKNRRSRRRRNLRIVRFYRCAGRQSLIYIQGGWRHDAVLLKGLK